MRTRIEIPPAGSRTNRVKCHYHCRACESCFSSLSGFDAHRQFEEGHKGDWEHRVCVEPADDQRFVALATDGVCDLARPPKAVTAVWTLRGPLEKVRERFGGGPKAGLEDAA